MAAVFAGAVLLAQERESESIVPPRFASAEQSALYDRVSSRLIAPCCWGEAVRVHQSPAASKVRMELIADIRAGMNESEIQDHFAQEYGERILGQPRGARSVVAYAIPSICGALGVLAMSAYLISRSRRVQVPAAGAAGEFTLPELE